MRQRAVPGPQLEIAVHCALGRKILGQVSPRTAGLQDVEQPADHRTDVDLARATAAFRWRDQRRKDRPFAVCQITRISQPGSIIPRSAFLRPHLVTPPTPGTRYRITTASPDSTSFRTGSDALLNGIRTTNKKILDTLYLSRNEVFPEQADL